MAKRIQFNAHGGPEVLEYVEFTPKDPAAGEVQISNKAIGINYIDTYIRGGRCRQPPAHRNPRGSWQLLP